jgi:molybdopterin/thiamine biosynthesis adenylyltransferase
MIGLKVKMYSFSEAQLQRYSRNILLKDVGVVGQEKLLMSRVLVIGAGGLGAPALLYLAAAGVGTIGIADGDRVELSNLQRQIIHFTKDIGSGKADSAAQKITALNPEITVKTYNQFLDVTMIRSIISDYDFVIDGTDNFSSKFLINDACNLEKKAFSHGGILGFTGQTMTVLPGQSTCYRCVFQDLPPVSIQSCSQAGVLGAVAGLLGTIQAAEAIKYCVGISSLLTDTLLVFDAKTMRFRNVSVKQRENCECCGKNASISDLKYENYLQKNN